MDRRLGDVVARGSRSTVYAWGRGAVVKVPDPGIPEGWIHSEAVYTAAVRDAGAPAPRLLGVEHVDGRAVSVFERIEGVSMWEEVRDRPERSATHGRLLADLQVSLFALVPPISLPSQRDRLMCKIQRAADDVDASLAMASSILPCPTTAPRLCHGDLHPGNVIMSPAGPVIIDWFDVSRGDPVADIARTSLLLLPEAEACPAHLPGAWTGPLVALAAAYFERVTRRIVVDGDRLERWRAVEAAARLAEGVSQGALLAIWRRAARLVAVAGEPALHAVVN